MIVFFFPSLQFINGVLDGLSMLSGGVMWRIAKDRVYLWDLGVTDVEGIACTSARSGTIFSLGEDEGDPFWWALIWVINYLFLFWEHFDVLVDLVKDWSTCLFLTLLICNLEVDHYNAGFWYLQEELNLLIHHPS